uniref:Fork-head domain-containing protein n=1 Tax=Plectus sambesii TaxID=2011161 RepID=A0A914UJP8_9BILA
MLPLAYNQLRQAALNYQLTGSIVSAGGSLDPRSLAPPNPYLPPYGLEQLYGYRPNFGAPRFVHEEPKPQHSYIGLIAMAILSTPDQKMILSDVYQWILDNYAYFRTRGPGWRNSIRHNLSLNDCFIKSGRSANGKGHYWAIHPANIEDFKRGDFRRRRAQRKVRKHMGLAVGEDDDDSDDSPCATPAAQQVPFAGLGSPALLAGSYLSAQAASLKNVSGLASPTQKCYGSDGQEQVSPASSSSTSRLSPAPEAVPVKKRPRFDVESLLAPETKCGGIDEAYANNKDIAMNGERASGFKFEGASSPMGLRPPFNFGKLAPNLGMHGLPWPWANLALPLPLPGSNMTPQTSFAEPSAMVPVLAAEPHSRTPSPNTALQWQESFAKIMARSYQNQAKNHTVKVLEPKIDLLVKSEADKAEKTEAVVDVV